jgi:hypothetical protein
MKIEDWQKALGEFSLPLADENNLSHWLQAVDSWVGSAAAALSALRQAALEQLLLVEGQVARFVREKMQPNAAPAATVVPSQYPLLVPGSERPRQKKLDLWDRFHVADGLVPTLARLTVACGIIAAVLSVGTTVGVTLVNVYNGLGRPVTVSIGEDSLRLAPFSHAKMSLTDLDHYAVKAVTDNNELIEQFDVDIPFGSSKSIYNVGSASALVEWTATYGNATADAREHVVGPVRWTTSNASFIFEEPPESISGSSNGGTRRVLGAYGHEGPSALMSVMSDREQLEKVVTAHAIWDPSDAPTTGYWLALASDMPSFGMTLGARLALLPNDVLTLRAEQDYARPNDRASVCERHRALASAQPDNFDLKYLVARCIEGEAQRDQAFANLYAQAPDNGWLAFAVGLTYLQQARWQDAVTPLDVALKRVPEMRETLAIDTLRTRRMLGADGTVPMADLLSYSTTLKYYATLESGSGLPAGNDMAYYHLGRGAPDLAAKALAEAPQAQQRILRLAAASDGADPELIKAALALPISDGIDNETIWTALALAMREGVDTAAYLDSIRESNNPDAQRMLDFIMAVRRPGNDAAAERLLDGVDALSRGEAYSAALVLRGQQAPTQWRTAANRLLFIPERPYFANVANDADGVKRTLPRLY